MIRFPVERARRRIREVKRLVVTDPGRRSEPTEYVWAPGWFAVRLRPPRPRDTA